MRNVDLTGWNSNALLAWPPRSRDIDSMQFCFWGTIKAKSTTQPAHPYRSIIEAVRMFLKQTL